jgi:hypothetical protein
VTETEAQIVEEVEFTCSERDFLDAHRLHHTLSLKGRRFLFLVSMIGIAVFGISMIGGDIGKSTTWIHALGAFAPFIFLLAILILVNRTLFLPRMARRQFLQNKEFRNPFKIGVRPPHIVLSSKNGFHATPTADFLKWSDNSKCILLYRSDRMFNFIPKRVLGDALHQKLIAELNRARVPKSGFSNS